MVAYGHIIPKLNVNIENVQIALITGLSARIIGTGLLVIPMTIVDGTESESPTTVKSVVLHQRL